MFTDVLPLIVKNEEIDLLLRLSEGEKSLDQLSKLLNMPKTSLEPMVTSLFVRGFLKKKRKGEIYYATKPFQSIVNRFLSEGRAESLGKYVAALADNRMKEHVDRAAADAYPEGKILPIPQAVLEPVSIVLPLETALAVLEKARSFSLRDCECRMTYKKCDKPVRTCLGLNEFSEELVERGVAERISLKEAKEVLNLADSHGLVHQVLYTDWLKGEVYDLCSCCSCCCQYLRAVLNYGVKHHIAKSGLVAKVDLERCNGCGTCVERCPFGARKLQNGKSHVATESCYGCGLCTTTCPTKASKLIQASEFQG